MKKFILLSILAASSINCYSQNEGQDVKPYVKDDSVSQLSQSTILSSKGKWTFLPKGSILNMPKNLERYSVSGKSGDYLPFNKFLKFNRGWLSTYEATNREIFGEDALTKSALKSIEKSKFVVVLTQNKNPVSTSIDILNPPNKNH